MRNQVNTIRHIACSPVSTGNPYRDSLPGIGAGLEDPETDPHYRREISGTQRPRQRKLSQALADNMDCRSGHRLTYQDPRSGYVYWYYGEDSLYVEMFRELIYFLDSREPNIGVHTVANHIKQKFGASRVARAYYDMLKQSAKGLLESAQREEQSAQANTTSYS